MRGSNGRMTTPHGISLRRPSIKRSRRLVLSLLNVAVLKLHARMDARTCQDWLQTNRYSKALAPQVLHTHPTLLVTKHRRGRLRAYRAEKASDLLGVAYPARPQKAPRLGLQF